MSHNTLPQPDKDLTNPTLAEQTLAFIFEYQDGDTIDVPHFEAGAVILKACVQELETLPDNSAIAWSQGCVNWGQKPNRPGRSDTLEGKVTKLFDDRSGLTISIKKPTVELPPKDPEFPFGEPELYISLQTTHAATTDRQWHVSYRIGQDETVVQRNADKTYGATIQAIAAMATKLLAKEPSEDELFEMLGASLTETSIIEEGLDPTIDPEVETLRSESEVYRELSDEMRNNHENRVLARQKGVEPEKRVGPREARLIQELLRSL